ncbi:MAG: hypothetical protein GSR74_04370 [Desulfurococcales archaeon]|nr:hypothetical protein [Desulfurococcales archaeon]
MPRLRLRRRRETAAERAKRNISTKEAIDYLAIRFFGKTAEKLVRAFELDKHLAEAGILTYPILYAARGPSTQCYLQY